MVHWKPDPMQRVFTTTVIGLDILQEYKCRWCYPQDRGVISLVYSCCEMMDRQLDHDDRYFMTNV